MGYESPGARSGGGVSVQSADDAGVGGLSRHAGVLGAVWGTRTRHRAGRWCGRGGCETCHCRTVSRATVSVRPVPGRPRWRTGPGQRRPGSGDRPRPPRQPHVASWGLPVGVRGYRLSTRPCGAGATRSLVAPAPGWVPAVEVARSGVVLVRGQPPARLLALLHRGEVAPAPVPGIEDQVATRPAGADGPEAPRFRRMVGVEHPSQPDGFDRRPACWRTGGGWLFVGRHAHLGAGESPGTGAGERSGSGVIGALFRSPGRAPRPGSCAGRACGLPAAFALLAPVALSG